MNNGHPTNFTTTYSSSFKCKSRPIRESTAVNSNRLFNYVKVAVLLRYLSNFWRSSEMPLINCKIHLELNWTKNCVMSSVFGVTTFNPICHGVFSAFIVMGMGGAECGNLLFS